MTLTRKLASALCLAFLFITLSSNAQVDSTTGLTLNATGNILNLGGGLPWSGTVTGSAGGYSGGSTPAYNPSTGNLIFGYTQRTVSQSVAISQALANAGTGIELAGYKYQWQIQNDLYNSGSNRGTLTGNVSLTGRTGNVLESFNYDYNYNLPSFTTFKGTQLFNNRYDTTSASNITVSFTGKDQNFWAGYYGPRVHVDSFSLLYTTNPCATNPAYSPNCTGYNNVVYSSSVFDNSVWGQAVSQAAAVNVALQNAGIGATVHGFNYAFDWKVGDRQCTSWFIVCWSSADSNLNVKIGMTDKNGSNLYSQTYQYSGENISGSTSGKYLLPSSTNQTNLGNVWASTSGWGDSYASNFRSSLIYTPDPCVADPLYSTQCKGYAVAYAKTMILGSTVASASYIAPQGPAAAPSVTAPDPTVSPAQQGQEQTQQQTQQTQQQSSPAPAQDTNQNPAVAQDNPTQPSTQQAGPAPTSPQPAGGPPQTATASTSNSSGPGGGGSAGPSKLAMSVLRTAQANDKATQAAAVQNAAKTLENATQSSQASSNAAISMVQDMSANSATAAANFASQSTQTSIQVSVQTNQQTTQSNVQQTQQSSRVTQQLQQQDVQVSTIQSNNSTTSIQQFIYTPPVQQQEDTQSTQIAILKPPVSVVVEVQQQSSNGTGLIVSRNLFAYNPLIASTNTTNMSTPLPTIQPMYQPKLDSIQAEVDTSQYQMSSFSGVGKAGNPLSEIIMQQRFELMQNNITQTGSSVNRNVLPNELAGFVDIASIANIPAGFNSYSFVLKDASFYEIKEVYKNQRTVDNERVLRGLTRGSDSLHQQMVDQQYKLGE